MVFNLSGIVKTVLHNAEVYSEIASTIYDTVNQNLSTSLRALNVLQAVDLNKLNRMQKCDDFATISMYMDRELYYVIFVKRRLILSVRSDKEESERLRDKLLEFYSVIVFFDEHNSEIFSSRMQILLDSINSNPTYRAIHHMCAAGFSDALHYLFSISTEPIALANEVTSDGLFSLNVAAEGNFVEIVSYLLNNGAVVEKKDSKLRNILHYAAKSSPAMIKHALCHLLSSEAMDQCDENGLTPLCIAIEYGSLECIDILLRNGCSTGPFPRGLLCQILLRVREVDSRERTLDLLRKYAPHFLDEPIGIDGSTLLHSDLDASWLVLILSKVSNVSRNLPDRNGRTPLHISVLRRNLEQTLILLSFDITTNSMDKNMDCPLTLAMKAGSVELVKVLLCFGATIDGRVLDFARLTEFENKGHQIVDDIQKLSVIDSGEITQLTFKDHFRSTKFFDVNFNFEVFRCAILPKLFYILLRRKLKEESLMDGKNAIAVGSNETTYNILCLDGGGVRGLIMLQILAHIECKLGSSVMEHFNWLGGTSTGAIIALGLASGYKPKACRRLYLRFISEVFEGEKPYSDEKLEQILKRTFGEELKMRDIRSKKVMVTAASIEKSTPKLKIFRNYELPVSDAENISLGYDSLDLHVWKCARFSSAAPTYFKPKDGFIDGALMANNPTLDLLSDIRDSNSANILYGNEKANFNCIVSLGTGIRPTRDINVGSLNFCAPQSFTEGCQLLTDFVKMKDIIIEQITASDGEYVKRARSWAHDLKVPFFRFSPQLTRIIEMDTTRSEDIIEIFWETEKYLRTVEWYNVELLIKHLKKTAKRDEST